MTARLQNEMKKQAAQVVGSLALPRIGIVTSVDTRAGSYCAKVKIQPEGIETGFLPISSQFVGNGWGLHLPPVLEAQAIVVFAEGDIENGIIVGFLYSNKALSLAAPAGDAWLVHTSGSSLKFNADGTVTVNAPAGFKVTGNTEITGTLKVTSDVTDNSGSNAQTMKSHRDAYNAHKHSGVQTGGGTSGVSDHIVP